MDRIVCFIDCAVPVMLCNFKCKYCSVAQKKMFGNEFLPFKSPPEHIAKALSPERFGGL